MRMERKEQHIENYLKSSYQGDTLLRDVFLEHNATPELSLEEIDTTMNFLDRKIGFPLMINAMTGGTETSSDINEDLSRLAKEFQIPMAVGSQTVALENRAAEESFRIVREICGAGHIIIGNLSANRSVDDFYKASEMIDADGMQIHLNTVQELVMAEGDRDFRGILNNIQTIVEKYPKPVIVKEIGFGISRRAAGKLYDVGVRNIDVSGTGGTNFIEIEDLRRYDMDFSDLYSWGIPTAKAIINCRELPEDLSIIASGGIKTSLDLVKSLVLGAKIVGISGEILRYLLHGGYDNARKYLLGLIHKTKILMLLLGKKNISQLRSTEYKILGSLKDIL